MSRLFVRTALPSGARVSRLFVMSDAPTTIHDVGQRRRAKVSGSGVKILREARGMTQRDLAELLRVETRTVARWEHDNSDGVVIGEIDYLPWLGVLHALGAPADWEPGDPIPPPVDEKPGDG